MIRGIEQIEILLENISENLVEKKSEGYDFQKKTPSLKHSQKEVEQEKFLLRYVRNHLTPETKIGKETTDLQKKIKELNSISKRNRTRKTHSKCHQQST